MDAETVVMILVNGLDDKYLKNSRLVFGQWTQEGFTLESGDEKFRVTVEKVE